MYRFKSLFSIRSVVFPRYATSIRNNSSTSSSNSTTTTTSLLEKQAQQLTRQLLNIDWLSKDLQLVHESDKLLSKYRSVYNTPDGKKIEETMRQLYQAKEAARIGAALSVHIENLLSKVMTSLGPLGNHVSKKDGYEQAVKETIRVYDELLEKLSGSVKQKAIDNLSQRIIQLRQTVHVSNFRYVENNVER